MAETSMFLSSKRVDRATIVVSSEESSLPGSNLQTIEWDRVWRATGCVAEYATFDLGAAYACNAFGWVGGNQTGAATARVRGAATPGDVTAAPGIDSTEVSVWPVTGKPTEEDWPVYANLIRWTNETGYRYWRVDWYDPTNPDGYTEIGRPFLGRQFRPRFRADVNGLGFGLSSPDKAKPSDFNKMTTDPRGAPSRRFRVPFSNITKRDMADELFELQRYCGLARDFMFSLDPSETTDLHKFTMQAVFAENAGFESIAGFRDGQLWRQSISINEPL